MIVSSPTDDAIVERTCCASRQRRTDPYVPAQHHKRSDRDVGCPAATSTDASSRVDAGREAPRDRAPARPGPARRKDRRPRSAFRGPRRVGQRLRHQNRTRLGAAQLCGVAGRNGEGQRVGTGPVQRTARCESGHAPSPSRRPPTRSATACAVRLPAVTRSAARFELLDHALGQIQRLVRRDDAVVRRAHVEDHGVVARRPDALDHAVDLASGSGRAAPAPGWQPRCCSSWVRCSSFCCCACRSLRLAARWVGLSMTDC